MKPYQASIAAARDRAEGSGAGRPFRDARERGVELGRARAHPPDATLVRQAAAGGRAAFETLVRRHYDHMHRLAWRMTGSVHDAEDIAQEVCCGLADKLAGFKGEARFSTWLSGVVINACRDLHRRAKSQDRHKQSLSILVSLARPADGRDLYRQSWLASEIGRLAPELRETILLVVGEGLTHAEAGAALGIAEATVSWRLHEARKQVGGRAGDPS